jgi:hypothetical protein
VVYFDADLRVAAYNHAAIRWLQLEGVGDPTGLHHSDLTRRLAERGEFDPEDKEEAVAAREAMVKTGQRITGERARDGRIFAYAFNPLPEGSGVLTFSDVTEARRREARLARGVEGLRYRFRN